MWEARVWFPDGEFTLSSSSPLESTEEVPTCSCGTTFFFKSWIAKNNCDCGYVDMQLQKKKFFKLRTGSCGLRKKIVIADVRICCCGVKMRHFPKKLHACSCESASFLPPLRVLQLVTASPHFKAHNSFTVWRLSMKGACVSFAVSNICMVTVSSSTFVVGCQLVPASRYLADNDSFTFSSSVWCPPLRF